MAENELVLNLSVGDALQLQYYPCKISDTERFYVRVIGFLNGQSIITTIPTDQGKVLPISENDVFAVRLLAGNSVQAFVCSIIKKSVTPYRYIHLSYPKKLESKIVRQAQRAMTKIIATVQNEEPGKSEIKTKSALISDMSTAGALIESEAEIGEVGDTITTLAKIKVADIEDYVTLSAIIRRIIPKKDDSDRFKYGIQFVALEDKDKLTIHGFVYEQIAKANER
jgi:c-di-GMP-binding flagellar brake protein YcgR